MDIWSWIRRLWSSETSETTTMRSTPQQSDSVRRRDTTETDSSSAPSVFALSPARDSDAGIPDTWHIGDVLLEQYEVMDVLGEGGMGTVYKVHHRGWNTDLAVKSPRAGIFARTDGKE